MRRSSWAGLLALVFVFAGCNKEELGKLKAENTKLKAENTKLKAENTKLKADVAKSLAELKVFKDAESKKRNAKEDARKRALEYYQQLANVLALQMDGEEAAAKLCSFFTCDSMATKADVAKIVKGQHGRGTKGWRILSAGVPKSRVELLGDGKVRLKLESKDALACLLPGKATESADGVQGCKKARKQPWRSKCEHSTFTWANVDGVWKRSGIAYSKTVRCP
jgi:regulator of replication initiation timing